MTTFGCAASPMPGLSLRLLGGPCHPAANDSRTWTFVGGLSFAVLLLLLCFALFFAMLLLSHE